MTAASCFHCGLPVAEMDRYAIVWNGEPRALCCAGCQAVAHAIIDAGLADYYRHRTSDAPAPQSLVPDALRQLSVYDHPSVQQAFVRDVGNRREATLILEGISCAACVWLNEQHLRRLPGVESAEVNYTTRRARVVWDDARLHLSDILAAVLAIGYRAYPYDPARQQQVLASERRTLLRRLGVAGILSAQVMTLSEALYFGDWAGSDPALRVFFSWVSLFLTLPVLLYAAIPFFRAAMNDLRHRRLGMDVPIVLSIVTAFAASAWSTISGDGVIYYDAVTMFVFLLLGARYFEQRARTRAAEAAESLVQAPPTIATRLAADGSLEQIPAAELLRGDTVLVRPGETVPADGAVITGRSSVNESLLTGESAPLVKATGDRVIGGSINVESALTVKVSDVGATTVLSSMLRLLDRALSEKPRLAQAADRVAGWFIAGILLVSLSVGFYWWLNDPTQLLPIVVSVWIVTCPCAVALATPAAVSAATGALARQGLLITRGHALETLARATHFVFDKTGTLTTGRLRVARVVTLGKLAAARCLAIAGSLEQHSEHPIARALVAAARDMTAAENVQNHPGAGIVGHIANELYALGTPSFVEAHLGRLIDASRLAELRTAGDTIVVLADAQQALAAFVLADAVRPGAAALVNTLKRRGVSTTMLTGDHEAAATRVAAALDVETVRANLKPGDKLAYVQALQRQGAVVAMVGDGINDAPVLAGASVSVAVNGAAAISTCAADIVLLASDLDALTTGVQVAHRTRRIVRQNLFWAIAYNIVAIPAAAAGVVTPWMAALGMSGSSMFVVANALRLAGRKRNAPQPRTAKTSGKLVVLEE